MEAWAVKIIYLAAWAKMVSTILVLGSIVVQYDENRY